MFTNVSMAGTGTYVLLVNLALQALGYFGYPITVAPDDVSALVDAIAKIVAIALMIVGQFRRPDLMGGLLRRWT